MNVDPSPGLLFAVMLAPMPLDYLAADGKSHPGAFIGASPVKALKRNKYAVKVFLIEADAVIFHEYPAIMICSPGIYFYVGLFFAMKFQSVGNEILKKLTDLAFFTLDGRQLKNFYISSKPFNF